MTKFMLKEMRALLLGKKLGEGVARKVFVCDVDRKLVVKVESGSYSFQNVSEWETWLWAASTPALAKWFAPCVSISPSGAVLIQKRCQSVKRDDLPDKLPSFMSDLKAENFGKLNGRIVCLDYGVLHSCIRSASRTLKAVKWKQES